MMTWPYLGSVALVLAITLGILTAGRRWPGLAIAWIVYLVILAPNLGIVRIGNQLAADRYCYVASMSLAAVLAYGVVLVLPWIERRRHRVVALALTSSLLIAGLSALSWRQCRTWETTAGLWRHVRDHGYPDDVTVLFYMGLNRSLAGDDRGAMEYYARALRSDPRDVIWVRSLKGSPNLHDQDRSVTKPFWYSLRWWIVVALAVVAATAFLPALNNGFLAFDDDENFLDNASFRGLGPSQIRWAWTTFLLGVYQPLAWMLLELEYVLAGLNPRGYHLVSIGLHAAVAVALFALIVAILRRCGWPANQAPGREIHLQLAAALAAALFAVHPLRVEVVAWASCQPYLPCALFSILTILAYLRTHDEPADADGGRRRAWMMVTLALFTAALLSKAVAVTLPLVLLAIDVYPLCRLRADLDLRRRVSGNSR